MKALRDIIKEQSGFVIITFAVMINILILAISLTMDLGRGYALRSAVDGALDAASIASAVEGGDAQKAQDYFVANLPNGLMGITYNYNSDITHVADNNTVTMQSTGVNIPAVFSAGNNIANRTVDLTSGVQVGLSASTFLPADYFFVVDASGSMSGAKRQDLENALRNFISLVFPNQEIGADGLPNYRVSLTNYSSSYGQSFPLMSDQKVIEQMIPQIAVAGGMTCGQCGMREGKDRMLEDLMDPISASRQKIFIFMTDGQLNQSHDSLPGIQNYSPPTPPNFNQLANVGTHHRNAYLECETIKNVSEPFPDGTFMRHTTFSPERDIEITTPTNISLWTVRFGSGSNSGSNRELMDACATDPAQSVFAADGNALNQIFALIGMQTSRIRILQ
jgi:Flp pilus assembly protein TadG